MKKLLLAILLAALAAGCASRGGGYAPMGYLIVEDCAFRYCYSPYYDAGTSAVRSPSRSEVLRVERERVPILVERERLPGFSPAMGSGSWSDGNAGGSVTVERMAVAPPVSQGEPRSVSPRDPN